MQRKNKLKKNISFGIVYSFFGMILSYISIPIVLGYLGEKYYGVWLTIFSVLSWIYTFDIGIGNGLKIRLTEALSKNNNTLAKEYISTSYIIIFVLTIVILLIGLGGIYFIEFKEILNINFMDEIYLKKVILISFLFVLSNFVIGIYKQLLISIHEAALVNLTNVVYQIIVISLLLIIKEVSDPSLLVLSFVYGVANLLTGVVFTLVFFKKKRQLWPQITSFNRKIIKNIMGLGLEFFIIKICVIIIFTTDNLIITHLIGPQAVTAYNVVFQLFQAVIVIWYLVSAPLTPLYTEAYNNNDLKWIKKTLIRLNVIFIFIFLCVSLLIVIAPFILQLWLGRELYYPKFIFTFFGAFVLIRVYGDLYMSFLNGIGKLRIQVYLSIFGALINIPLSVYFINNMELGSSGVILATSFSLILLACVMPLQTYFYLKEKKG